MADSNKDRKKQNLVQKLSTQTKDGLKIENQRLDKVLSGLKSKYRLTHDVIKRLDQGYEQSKENLMMTRYNHLKQLIREATADQNIEQSVPPQIPKHKGVKELFRGTEGTTQVHQPVTSKPTFLQACKQFAGKAEDGAYEMETVTRNLSDMHKKEIEDDNHYKEHMISVYENKFLRAHNRLNKLKQEYLASKEDLPPIRYQKLKDMIKIVIKDDKLNME